MLLNNIHNWKDFTVSKPENKIYSVCLQRIFDIQIRILMRGINSKKLGFGAHHYSDLIMGAMSSRFFAQTFVQAQIKENIKAPRHRPLWVEFTGDRWISLAKCQ